MAEYLGGRFFDWMTYEPVVGLMMIVAAVVLFIGGYRRGAPGDGVQVWVRRIVEAAGMAVLFLGLLWAFRAVLNDNASTFRQNHGRVSEANYESLKTIWGGPHVQRELTVRHYRTVVEREEMWREDPSLPPLYRDVKREVYVDQNSLLSSHGTVDLTLNERRKGSALYNGFDAVFDMTWVVKNESGWTTRAEFGLPLSGQVLYDELVVQEDGADISRDLRFSSRGIEWVRHLQPGERHVVHVRYATRGVEYFYYQVPERRELKDFVLAMNVHGLAIDDVNYPERCLTPMSVEPSEDGTGTTLTWTLDRSVTTAGMGVALPTPIQPGAKVSLVLRNSPYALMLLVVAVALTLLVRREDASLFDLSLLSATYCVLFLCMASFSDFLLGFWGSLVLGAALTVGMAALLYRRHAARVPILALTAFFTLVYPLSGLFPDHQDAVDGMVAVGLIVYLFLVAIIARMSTVDSRAPEEPGAVVEPAPAASSA
jgi:hypothetical protein